MRGKDVRRHPSRACDFGMQRTIYSMPTNMWLHCGDSNGVTWASWDPLGTGLTWVHLELGLLWPLGTMESLVVASLAEQASQEVQRKTREALLSRGNSVEKQLKFAELGILWDTTVYVTENSWEVLPVIDISFQSVIFAVCPEKVTGCILDIMADNAKITQAAHNSGED